MVLKLSLRWANFASERVESFGRPGLISRGREEGGCSDLTCWSAKGTPVHLQLKQRRLVQTPMNILDAVQATIYPQNPVQATVRALHRGRGLLVGNAVALHYGRQTPVL